MLDMPEIPALGSSKSLLAVWKFKDGLGYTRPCLTRLSINFIHHKVPLLAASHAPLCLPERSRLLGRLGMPWI